MKQDLEVINAQLYLIVPISIFIVGIFGAMYRWVQVLYSLFWGVILIIFMSNYLFNLSKKYL